MIAHEYGNNQKKNLRSPFLLFKLSGACSFALFDGFFTSVLIWVASSAGASGGEDVAA
jgi:hypothetical protein